MEKRLILTKAYTNQIISLKPFYFIININIGLSSKIYNNFYSIFIEYIINLNQ